MDLNRIANRGIVNQVKETPKKIVSSSEKRKRDCIIKKIESTELKVAYLKKDKYEKLKKIAAKNNKRIGAALDDILTYFFENYQL